MYSLIIPCYNEGDSLKYNAEKLITFSNKNQVEIILVNNGSTDNTDFEIDNIVKQSNSIKKNKKKNNKGYGHGLLQGILNSNFDLVSWIHGDFQVDLNDVAKGYKLFIANGADKLFVKGKRKERIFYDKIFTFFLSLIASLLFFRKINDSNAIPTFTSKTLFKDLNNIPDNFNFDVFCHIAAVKKNYKIVRFNVFYRNRQFGSSKWNFGLKSKIKLSFVFLIFLFKKRFSKISN